MSAGSVASSLRRTSAFDLAALSVPLHLNYDAQSQPTTEGGAVTTLTDQSTSALSGVKAGSGTVTYSATSLAGKPAWTIPAGAYFDTPAFTSIATTVPITAYAVVQNASIGSTDRTILHGQTGFTLVLATLAAGTWAINRGGANVSGGTSNTSPHRVRGLFAGSGSPSASAVYVDGTLAAGPGSGGTTAQTRFRVGATSSGFGNFNGKLGQLIIFRGAPTTGELASIDAYLAARWGF